MARQAGVCLRHKGRLVCPTCAVSPPMPEELAAMVQSLVDAITGRLDAQGLDDALRRVPKPPTYAACAACGTAQECGGCTQDYGEALLDALAATPAERAIVAKMRATCRRIDRERRRQWTASRQQG